MDSLRGWPGGLAVVAILLGTGTLSAEPPLPLASPSPAVLLPLVEELPAEYQARVRFVLQKPTLHVRGPLETFRCRPETYHWLLDHPDRAVKGWQRLGARCAGISDRGNGRFGCRDEHGSDIHWDTVRRLPQQRIWYAEGRARPGFLLPFFMVRAVVVLHIREGHDRLGRPALRHQGELILHTDSKALSLAARLFGASAPRVAEQYVGQIQTFFAALAWYVNEHPEKSEELLAD